MRCHGPAFVVTVVLGLAQALPAQAQDCHVKVLRPVADDLGNRWKAGDTLPVDIERDTRDGGAYCAHGGGCLPRSIGRMAAVRLQDCHVGPSIGDGDYRLVPGS